MLSLLKKTVLANFVFVQQKTKVELIRRKKILCRFSVNSTFCLNFLGKVWCDFYHFDIFPTFEIIFRVCVNFCGSFGAVMIFL